MNRATQFREAAALANRHRDKRGWRYPAPLQRLAIEHCRDQRRRSRRPYSEIAEELGISPLTLSSWLAQHKSAPEPGFHEVCLEPATASRAPASLSVLTPSGVRIEGLDLTQALELARAL